MTNQQNTSSKLVGVMNRFSNELEDFDNMDNLPSPGDLDRIESNLRSLRKQPSLTEKRLSKKSIAYEPDSSIGEDSGFDHPNGFIEPGH